MILKQNCFIITDNELDALEQDQYVNNHRLTKTSDGLGTIEVPVAYTGSSLQRRNNNKATKKTLRLKDCNPVERNLSDRSKTKIRNKIMAWTYATKHNTGKPRFTFLTLTLTSKQLGPDSNFTKMLNVLFTYCRSYFSMKNYLYVLERQKNGNIHAHVIIDRPLPIQRLNYIWCKILGDAGYTFKSTDQRTGKTETVNVREAFMRYRSSPIIPGQPAGEMKRYVNSPNPADITYIYNIKEVSKYVTKYITKNETKINTLIWNCSQSISKLWVGAILSAKDYYLSLKQHSDHIIRQTLDVGHVLNICLLKFYTKIQEQIFSDINRQYLVT